MLGGSDDSLYAGAGNDTVGSAGGDDKVYGEAGDDMVFGGIGNDFVVGGNGDDIVHGNDGDDILQGGNSDAGTWTFTLDSSKQMHLNFTPVNLSTSSPTSLDIWTHVNSLRGTIDDRIALGERDYSRLETITLIYKAVMGVAPSKDELIALDNLGYNAHGYAQMAYKYYLVHSINPSMTDLVIKVWGSSDGATIELGNAYITSGGNWADALLYLANHDNNRQSLLSADGTLKISSNVIGEAGAGFSGAGDDQLFGDAGNDLLLGGTGNNLLDGGDGIDMASFVGVLTDYTIGYQKTAENIVDLVLKNIHSGDTNILRNIELVKIGSNVCAGNMEMANLSVTNFKSLADVAKIIGTAEFGDMELPTSWLN